MASKYPVLYGLFTHHMYRVRVMSRDPLPVHKHTLSLVLPTLGFCAYDIVPHGTSFQTRVANFFFLSIVFVGGFHVMMETDGIICQG